MEKIIKPKMLELIINPNKFFKELYYDNNYRKHKLFLGYASIAFVILWFTRIFYLIFSPNHFNDDVALYAELFRVIDARAFGIFLGFLFLDIFAIFLFSVIVASLSKLIGYFFKVKLSFGYYWKIVSYVTMLIVPVIIIRLLLDILLLSGFYKILSIIFGTYSLVLLILGIKTFSKQERKK